MNIIEIYVRAISKDEIEGDVNGESFIYNFDRDVLIIDCNKGLHSSVINRPKQWYLDNEYQVTAMVALLTREI